MDQITDQVQPVSHPVLLTCALCIGAAQRAAAGKATRAKAGLMTHRVFERAASRDPPRPGPALRSARCSPARPGACSPRTSRGFRDPGRGPADGRHRGVDG
jgi:hypothetical protein